MVRLQLLLVGFTLIAWSNSQCQSETLPIDPALVLHYTFDFDTDSTATDKSSHGNDGEIRAAEYLDEVDGRQGVLRFDGKDAVLKSPDNESLYFRGDMSVELWVRLNGSPGFHWSSLVRDANSQYYDFGLSSAHTLVFWYLHYDLIHGIRRSWDPANGKEQLVVPVDRNILSEQWSHIAVVVEYPRCRFYHNGELVRDGYMPLPGIGQFESATHIGARTPMDLDEIRLYRRALSPAEVAAHAHGIPVATHAHHELAVEPHWYDKQVTVRLSCKGSDLTGHTAKVMLKGKGHRDAVAPQIVSLSESNKDSGRFIGAAVFPLAAIEGRAVDAVAQIHDPNGQTIATVYQHANLKKPDWVHSQAGISTQVPAPWTAVQAQTSSDGAVTVAVWGRRYSFGTTPLTQQIQTAGVELLDAPSTLVGRADGKDFRWTEGRVRLIDASPTVAHVEQSWRDDRLSIQLAAEIEFDGFMLFDGTIRARRDLRLDELRIEIPLDSRYAQLSYGHAVYPWNAEIPIKSFQSGKIESDQAFRFTQTAWLGDDEHGLCWQSESDEHWHNGNEQNALEILPRGPTTTFRMNLVDVPTDLVEGQVLHYRFSLQATPIKPLLRDSWDLRIARQEPYGRALELPDRLINGQPAPQYLADRGVRHIATMVCDIWPYPLPVHQPYSRLLHRLNDVIHAHGMKHYNYQLHERYSVMAPEWDIHGLHMANRPLSQYIPGSEAGEPRPGPVGSEYGANSQGTQNFCHKSMALQDASVHAVARRLDEYGDDGIYLDGTVRAKPCTNLLHGCGYRLPDGSVRPTFAIFAVRDFMKRIYNVVKQRRPDGVVDVHSSFMYNPSGLAFSDVMWTGEQWWHLKKTGGAPGSYVAGELPLEKFRTEFTGRQIGVAAEMLHYRLGSFNDVAATSLLHDIPSRPSTPFHTKDEPLVKRVKSMDSYFQQISKLWKLRDRFGTTESEKLFYWENQDYVTVSPPHCYATLFKHPSNGVLAFVSNLSPDAQTVTVQFNLDTLGLRGYQLTGRDPLADQALDIGPDGQISISLESEHWIYVWLRPNVER